MIARKPAPAKAPKNGFFPKIKGFLDALGDRYQRVLQVIDEALASENLKDKIWAVDIILKRTPAEHEGDKSRASKNARGKQETEPAIPVEDLDSLSDPELLARIQQYLRDIE